MQVIYFALKRSYVVEATCERIPRKCASRLLLPRFEKQQMFRVSWLIELTLIHLLWFFFNRAIPGFFFFPLSGSKCIVYMTFSNRGKWIIKNITWSKLREFCFDGKTVWILFSVCAAMKAFIVGLGLYFDRSEVSQMLCLGLQNFGLSIIAEYSSHIVRSDLFPFL